MTCCPRQPELPKALIPALDACAICRQRDESRHHGASHCMGDYRRQHPKCTRDGKQPRFSPDLAVIANMER